MLPARGEAPAVRHPPAEGCPVVGGPGGGCSRRGRRSCDGRHGGYPHGAPDTSARLFGVSIGQKRSRDSDDGGGREEDPRDDGGEGADVKPEQADRRPDSQERSPDGPDQHSWPIYRPKPVYRACNGPDGAGSDQDRSNSR